MNIAITGSRTFKDFDTLEKFIVAGNDNSPVG